MPIFTRRSRASTLQIISARFSENGTMVTFALDTSFLRHTSTSCHRWLRRCGGIWCRFSGTIVTLMPEAALVSFGTLAFVFPLVTSTFSSFNATHFLATRNHCSCLNSLISGAKVSDLFSFSPSSSISDNWASISVDEFPCRTEQFQYGFELRGLTYSQFVQTFQDMVGGNF